MKNTLLFFGFSKKKHASMIERLRTRGYRIIATCNLSKFHERLESARNPLVLLTDAVIARYHVPPEHLQMGCRGNIPLIVVSEDGSPAFHATLWTHPSLNEGGERKAQSPDEFGHSVREVIEIIDRAGHFDTCNETEPAYSSEGAAEPDCSELLLPDGINSGDFHKKMRYTLSIIARSGSEGIDCEGIAGALWPKRDRNHCKDVQIYVSKIRKRLDLIEPNRYRIINEKGRYRLTDSRRL